APGALAEHAAPRRRRRARRHAAARADRTGRAVRPARAADRPGRVPLPRRGARRRARARRLARALRALRARARAQPVAPPRRRALGPTAGLRLPAGRAADRAGDLPRAREHYEEACHADGQLLPAFRAMRHLLLRTRDLNEAVRHLDIELELCSPAAREPLTAL